MFLLATSVSADPTEREHWTTTVYAARISSEATWQHVIRQPLTADYTDSWLLAAALSRPWARLRDDGLRFEAEAQLVRHFGEQHHWEVNTMPVVVRWRRFPWDERVATSVAFGLGLSYATEVPPLEVELEGDSEQWLVYWMFELTAGPPAAAWAATLRLHHRSVAWGLMGDDGGANALGLGVRYQW
jgi:hypothetical protein